jgi:hypothetical protein
MRAARCIVPSVAPSAFAGFRFPPEVITLAVRWYLRFGLSYRDLEELLAERGIDVDHVSIFRWVQRFTPLLAHAAHPCRHRVGDRWWVDETYVIPVGAGPGQPLVLLSDLSFAVLRLLMGAPGKVLVSGIGREADREAAEVLDANTARRMLFGSEGGVGGSG